MKSVVRITGACRSNKARPTKAVLPAKIRDALPRHRGQTVVKFGDEIGSAVLSGSDLEAAKKLPHLVGQRGVHAAERGAEIMRTAQHHEARSGPGRDQKSAMRVRSGASSRQAARRRALAGGVAAAACGPSHRSMTGDIFRIGSAAYFMGSIGDHGGVDHIPDRAGIAGRPDAAQPGKAGKIAHERDRLPGKIRL
jgi:hypothetical protein